MLSGATAPSERRRGERRPARTPADVTAPRALILIPAVVAKVVLSDAPTFQDGLLEPLEGKTTPRFSRRTDKLVPVPKTFDESQVMGQKPDVYRAQLLESHVIPGFVNVHCPVREVHDNEPAIPGQRNMESAGAVLPRARTLGPPLVPSRLSD